MRNRNDQIGTETRAGKGGVGGRKGWEKDGGERVRGVVSTRRSVGPRGNYPRGQSEGLREPAAEGGMRTEVKSVCVCV